MFVNLWQQFNGSKIFIISSLLVPLLDFFLESFKFMGLDLQNYLPAVVLVQGRGLFIFFGFMPRMACTTLFQYQKRKRKSVFLTLPMV